MDKEDAVEQSYTPDVGEMVRDIRRPAFGVVAGQGGKKITLRPLRAGKCWEADPEDIRPVGQLEVVSARATDAYV